MNGYERMIAEQSEMIAVKDEQILRQRVEIDRLRIKVDRLERALSGTFYRVTGALSFMHLVMGELPAPPLGESATEGTKSQAIPPLKNPGPR